MERRNALRMAVIGTAVLALVGVSTAGAVIARHHPPEQSADSAINAAAATSPVTTIVEPRVAPLRHLSQADLLVTTNRGLTSAQLAALRKATHARVATVLDVGTLRVGGRIVRALGVDPSEFRGFTPPPTAASNPLWANLAKGDVVASYDVARVQRLQLGSTVTVVTHVAQQPRVGAFAAFGLPQVDVVINRTVAQSLGMHMHAGMVLSAPGRSSKKLINAAHAVLGPHARIIALHPDESTYTGKPRTYRELYQAAARTCSGLQWQILAAIGQVESGHGVNVGPSSAGALGPMQFMPGTWAAWARDGDGDHKADIMNPYDAVYAAAAYLCWNGAGRGGTALEQAIFRYNHADWYVKEVLALAKLYR